MAVFQLVDRSHYHSPGEQQYISRAGHWILRLAGEGIWSIMEQRIDFLLFICSTWQKAEGHFPPWAHWLNVILSLRRKHMFLFSLGWHLGIWDAFVKNKQTNKQNRNPCGLTCAVPVITVTGVWADYMEKYLKCACQIKLVCMCSKRKKNFLCIKLSTCDH